MAIINNPALNAKIGDFSLIGGTPAEALNSVLNNLVTLALSIAGIYFFANLIMGGYTWISAGGDKESVQKARNRISNALIGIVFTFAIFTIIYIMEFFFGFNILKFNIPTP